jgi:hypothetical protein
MARPIQVFKMQHLRGIHTYREGSVARRLLGPRVRRGESVGGAAALESRAFSGGFVPYLLGGKPPTPSSISNTGLIDGVPLPTLMGFTTFVAH